MQHSAGEFQTHDGINLYTQQWLPEEGHIKANLAVVHGFGEHSGRYERFAAWFVPHGYAVHSFDHRGHGRSPGQRGHINRWDEYREDVRVFLDRVRKLHPGPIFLIGHSLGGLIVLDYGLHYRAHLKGVVASGPALQRGRDTSPLLVLAGQMLSPVMPKLKLDSHLKAEGLARDAEVVRAYRADPLVHGWATPRFGAEMVRTMKWVLRHAPDWPADLPLLIVHGKEDPLCPPEASAMFYAFAGAKDKTRHEYPDRRHEVFNDLGREEVLQDVLEWLEKHQA